MPTTANAPKCYAEVKGRRLLDWAINAFADAGVTDICFIGGYRIESVQPALESPVERRGGLWGSRR